MHARIVMLLAALLVTTSAAHAQRRGPDRVPTGLYAGGSLLLAEPQGEFRDAIDRGFGAQGHLLYAPRGSVLGLRLDAGALTYGNERFAVPLSPTIGGRIQVDVKTSNNIAFVGVGPQLGLPGDGFRPYANAFAGVAYLYTESKLEGIDDELEFARTTNHEDATFAWGGGAGVYVPIRGGASPISIDLGARYHNNGEADYLREGDIRDNPDGSITLSPTRSDTDLVTFHLGVSVGIARDGDRSRRCRRCR